MTIFFIVVFAAYALGVLTLCFGWAQLQDLYSEKPATDTKFLSVVVAFRNEEKNLPKLIESLLQQTYPKDRWELILVNDHSDNGSVELGSSLYPPMNILNLPLSVAGKKAALDFGINHSRGEIVVTTDADCVFANDWLQKINASFKNDTVKMVVGGVRLQSQSNFFTQLQSLEFASLVGVAGATIGLGHPMMCNGANLAFRRAAFDDVKGYHGNFHIPSGDDEFLMRKISARWNDGILFLYEHDGVVTTQPQRNISDFFHQRFRWAGKWKHNSSLSTKIVALSVLLFQVSFLAFFLLAGMGVIESRLALFLFLSKLFAEMIFLFLVTTFLRQPWRWIPFFVLQFIYPIYVVFVGVLSQGMGYEWKNRRTKSN